MNSTSINRIIPNLVTVIIVSIMMALAVFFKDKEIIFPEITALAIGYIVSDKKGWVVNGRRMLGLITVCACLGLLIVKYVHVELYFQIMLAFIIAQFFFMYSGTTLAPFISAIVLPVMLQTESIVYPVAAFCLTFTIILARKYLIFRGYKIEEKYVPQFQNSKDDKIDTIIRIICIAVIGYVALKLGYKYIIAPPLLVAFTELSRPGNKARKYALKIITLFTSCALLGVGARIMISQIMGLSILSAAIIATIAMLIIINKTNMYLPPAGAITILSMIIPDESLRTYPIQIFLGTLIITFICKYGFMLRQESNNITTNNKGGFLCNE